MVVACADTLWHGNAATAANIGVQRSNPIAYLQHARQRFVAIQLSRCRAATGAGYAQKIVGQNGRNTPTFFRRRRTTAAGSRVTAVRRTSTLGQRPGQGFVRQCYLGGWIDARGNLLQQGFRTLFAVPQNHIARIFHAAIE